ncbi:MAG: hypothetical protein E7598_03300 [Ruminococcaceae bacterium]|nr:hypothetical protein [Oscillospiraceae bacterium]
MIPNGYKQTEIGAVPDSWNIISFDECFKIISNNTLPRAELSENVGTVKNIHYGDILVKYNNVLNCTSEFIPYVQDSTKKIPFTYLKNGDLIIADTAEDETVGKAVEISNIGEQKIVAGLHTIPCRAFEDDMFVNGWLGYFINHSIYHDQLLPFVTGTKVSAISKTSISSTLILVPPLDEQKRIAEALSDVDGMISSLEKLIAKKKAIKQGAMQELLTGKKRLPGFTGEWERRAICDIATVLDDHRTPVKESDREKMEGSIPYCGANGVVGYVNNFTIDDEIILIAEDGGYFDEYATRPIAYKMSGKCWVNNHAHVLKSKANTNQDYLFYSLVHKDIRDFITSGTRSKLNKAELLKITISVPPTTEEQTAIASILSDMDSEIEALEQKLAKTRQLKQGMMQQLLTGKIRLV